ncbi:hypothetical protein FNF27_00553 [Cafeteria roenbergensis]|uniref:TIR domain-containing protein n=2 Tax=Cafeteria roenbergensis TaxID=33653 RepID=A0A5A8D838_CAFRO|nr:hypothetical protein FNF31_04299 [Cafeteria roenbergensis]KAA0178005.1 hypothetical protein FNF27_00553 [Cafeteria roenbergensis]
MAASHEARAAPSVPGAGDGRVKREIFLSYGHGGYTQLVRLVAQGLLERGHTVWFDELALEVGHKWADKMSEGLRDGAGASNKLVIFFLDYYACRRDEDNMPQARGNGFCVNEMAIASTTETPLLVVALADAHPPAPLCFEDKLCLDVRDVLGDRDLRLQDRYEGAALDAITAAQAAPEEELFRRCDLGSVPNLASAKDVSAAMAAYFLHRPGAISVVRRIVDMAGQPDPVGGIGEAARLLGAKTTVIRHITHYKREEPREPAAPGLTTGPKRRLFIVGERGVQPLLLRLRDALVARGHDAKSMHCDAVAGRALDSADAADHGINWATERKDECPGILLVLMSDGFVEPSGDIIAKANSSFLPVVPLRVTTTCVMPITLITIQYQDFVPAVAGAIEDGSFEVHAAFDHFAELLGTSLDQGLELHDQTNAARRRVEGLFKPQAIGAEIARHTLFCGRTLLKAEVEAWRLAPTSAVVRVYEGHLGCGKTALASHLARTWPSVWALQVAAGAPDLRGTVLNLAFQLSSRLVKGPSVFLFNSDGSRRLYRTALHSGAEGPEPARTAELSELLAKADVETLTAELFAACLAPQLAALPERLRAASPVVLVVDGLHRIRVDNKPNRGLVLKTLEAAARGASSDGLQVRVLAFADAGRGLLHAAEGSAAAAGAATPTCSRGSPGAAVLEGASVEFDRMLGKDGSPRRDEMVQDIRQAVLQRLAKAAGVAHRAGEAAGGLEDMAARICAKAGMDFAWATELAQHVAVAGNYGDLPELEAHHSRRYEAMSGMLAEAGLAEAGKALVSAVVHKPDDAEFDLLSRGVLRRVMSGIDEQMLVQALSPMFYLRGPRHIVTPVAGEPQLAWLRTMSAYDSEGKRLWEAWCMRVLEDADRGCSTPFEVDREAVGRAAAAEVGGALALRLAGELVQGAGWDSFSERLSKGQKFALLVSRMRGQADKFAAIHECLGRDDARSKLREMGPGSFLIRTNRQRDTVVSSYPGESNSDNRMIYKLESGKYAIKRPSRTVPLTAHDIFDDLPALLAYAQLEGMLPNQMLARPSA